MDSTVECRASDGATVTIQTGGSVGDGYTGICLFELPKIRLRRQEFITGSRSLGERIATSPRISLNMRFDQSYQYQGGHLRLGTGDQPLGPDGHEYVEVGPTGTVRPQRLHFGVWEGAQFSVHTQLYGGEAEDLVTVFDQVGLAEDSYGVSCTPRHEAVYADAPRVLKDLPDLGLLDIWPRDSRTKSRTPRGKGTAVRGGELFVNRRGHHEMYFVLAAATAVAYVMPHANARQQDVLDLLSDLIVRWDP